MYPNNPVRSSCHSSSITELLGALCDCSLSGVSWKRRALGGVSREGFRRALKKRAYGALLSKIFQDGTKGSASATSAVANTPPRNKILMICFDLRVAGCREEAETLEEQLGRLPEGASSGLKEVDSVLELLVHLAGSAPPPPTSFSRDYMRRERPVVRKPQPWGYQSEELQRLEARAWGLVCGEEWGTLESLCGTQRMMDAPPGTGLIALRTKLEAEERFERETRLSLFGALQHTRTSEIDIRLDLPPVPSNIDVTGLAIRVPPCLDQSEDEGFQSSSNLTPDSQSEPSPTPEVDLWEALRTFEPGRRRCWESVGCPPGKRESLYLTEGGREAFDQLYRLWEGEMRVVCTTTPSPLLPLPLDSQTQLVTDLLNVLIGVASTTFPLNQSVQFDVRPGVCVSGASPESVSRLLGELAQYGTYYLRLSRFSLQSADKKGLVFQAFTGGLRKYLSLVLPCGSPQGVKLLSYLYNEAQNNCSNENYPVLLSLLKRSCEPYTRFVSDWVYSGVFRDVYGEFMIQVNEEYLSFRDKHFWVQGYTLISKDVEDCVPIFLRHIANDVYVCGKTINLLKICCPQHYICWSELPVPRIAVTFSLQEVEEIEKDCAVYRGRMERIAKHSAVSREEQVQKTHTHIVTYNSIFHFSDVFCFLLKLKQEEDDFSFARELRDREKRLQALEEQLEQRARKELIAQYSRLSEEAARRERRAMWRVQRMRLDEIREQFFMKDRQQIQVGDTFPHKNNTGDKESPTQEPSEQQPEKTEQCDALSQTHDASSPTHISQTVDSPLISEYIDVNDFLPKSPNPDSQQVDVALHEIGSDLPEVVPTVQPVDYDFSAPFSPLEGITGQASVQPRPRWGAAVQPELNKNHPSFSHIPIGENVFDIHESLPKSSPFGQVSKSSFLPGQYTLEETQIIPKASVYGHPSQATVQLVDGSVAMTDPKQEEVVCAPEKTIPINEMGVLPVEGEANKDENKPVETTKDVVVSTTTEEGNDANGEHEVTTKPFESTGITNETNPDDHSTDAHHKAGPLPLLVSDVTVPQSSPSVRGHSSDTHINIGQNVSEVTGPLPTPNMHGHASDSHIKIGEHEPKRAPLPGSAHGHSSDSNLGLGCVVSKAEPLPSPLPGSSYGHSSDSTLGVGCVVLGKEPQLSVIPGSAYVLINTSPHTCTSLDDTVDFGRNVNSIFISLLLTFQEENFPKFQSYNNMTPFPYSSSFPPSVSNLQVSIIFSTDSCVKPFPSLPWMLSHSPFIPSVSLVNKAVVDYFFVELGVERHFEALRHFLLMEDGEFAQSLSDLLFEKLGSGQTPGELLTPLVLNSILSKALQYSLHGDTPLASNFTFALRFLPETFHPHAPDSLNCLELRYKVEWPLNIIITDSCMNKYNRLFSFLLQLKHMVWSLRDVWFHLKRTALVKGAGRSVQFRQLQLYRHEMQHFVKVIQGYIANQILQVSWSEFTAKLAAANDLDAIHRTHADYLNRAIFRGLLTEKAAPVMNIIHSIFSLILKFRAQLIAQPWDNQQGEAVHPSFIAMQQSYNTFKYYSHFLFKVVTKLVNRGYQPHLEDFLLRINFNNYYKDS
uniref:Gamma-tubulin complex component 6 n=1 Tax=Sphaeramia orbicularis TaxID=375764 RepID=A0A672ZDG5_9TELE